MNIYKSNFSFLEDAYPLGFLAERSVFTDASNTLVKLRVMSEKITDLLIQYDDIELYHEGNQWKKLGKLESKSEDIPVSIFETLHSIRKSSNKAVHHARGTEAEATKFMLRKIFYRAIGFMNDMRRLIKPKKSFPANMYIENHQTPIEIKIQPLCF